jgi:serine/threonine-protein kinase
MEFVQGPTLSSLLHLDGMVPQHLASEYGAQIADALNAAYMERHVIHRDIKPENLMLDRWGKIKVMDFGLARATGLQQITITRTLVGSIYYASPEQIWGNTLDNRSDIYALGVVLYEMVSGQRPFQGRSMPELTQNIVRGNPLPPSHYNPHIAPELEEIILLSLSRDRNQRYPQAADMARELRNLNLPHPDIYIQQQLQQSGAPGISTLQGQKRSRVQLPKRPSAQRPAYLNMPQTTGEIAREALLPEKRYTNESEQGTAPLLPAIQQKKTNLEDIKTVPLEILQKSRGFWTFLRRLTGRT